MRKVVAVLTSVVVGVATLVAISASSAVAAPRCPDPKKDGVTVGKIIVGKTSVDVKQVTYPAGGEIDPPASPLNAGVSLRHMPLSSPIGSSIIVWHINYAGCIGKLNVVTKQKLGSTFSIVDEKGFKHVFKITQRVTVPKGKYKQSWFTLTGPRQLVMVTCTGRVRNGHYDKNLVVIATPVES